MCLDRVPEEIPNLTFLDLRQCNKVGDYTEIPNLTFLDLRQCNKVGDYTEIPNLTFLDLRQCNKVGYYTEQRNEMSHLCYRKLESLELQ